jgi:hypothetical protein
LNEGEVVWMEEQRSFAPQLLKPLHWNYYSYIHEWQKIVH